MESQHRTFVAAKPYVAPKRRKAFLRSVSLRKFGFTPSELSKIARRRKGA